MMTLWDLPPGKKAKICNYLPLDGAAVVARLEDLGFTKGAFVECVRHVPLSGPRVYVVSGSVFALEKPVAQTIEVEAESPA